ncbi:TlpA disulfide reductase family protein [Chakrabartyella piscis]|uniref:TlpA disulfide reductase family protein n=1 Tax=Chakrabartyella piscis TaxID=2918914 RepID=UPI002958A19E|nr:TlpA disulfide reductase family protein [Chakrabartyella piscis]
MKKQLSFLLTLLLLSATVAGCGNSQQTTDSTSNADTPSIDVASVAMEDATTIVQSGLTFSIPTDWIDNADINLMPNSFLDMEGDIFTQVKYSFIPAESFAELDDLESTVPVEDLMIPLFNLLVVQESMENNATFQSEAASYDTITELEPQEGYLYYLLSDYNGDTSRFSEEAMAVYTDALTLLPALEASIVTSPPNLEAVTESAAADNDYLAFISTTLEGDDINSTVFFDYDLTVVNFWGSYAYPDINELEELEAFYQQLQTELPNVNLIQVVIDTPDDAAEETVKAAYAEYGVTFTGMSPDATLGNWVLNNLSGIPTTVFVDSTCKVLDYKIEGIQNASAYMDYTKNVLEEIQ